MSELKLVSVPKELYYHEIAYVRNLEALAKRSLDFISRVPRSFDEAEQVKLINDLTKATSK